MKSDIRSETRNQIHLDSFWGYVIGKGIPHHFSLGLAGDDVQMDERVTATLVLKVPNMNLGTTRYRVMTFIGSGISMGHALQSIYDQMEREVL
jgi:hypothetical protein